MFCTSRGQLPERRRATSSTFRRLSQLTVSRPGRCIKSEEHISIGGIRKWFPLYACVWKGHQSGQRTDQHRQRLRRRLLRPWMRRHCRQHRQAGPGDPPLWTDSEEGQYTGLSARSACWRVEPRESSESWTVGQPGRSPSLGSRQDRQRPCLPSACRSVWSSGRSLAWAAGDGGCGRPSLAVPFHHYGENRQSLQMTRLSRVYIASASPTNQLFQIVWYLVGLYCPMWFHTRSHNSCIHGAGTFLRSLKLLTILCRTCRSRYSHWCGVTPTWVTQSRCCSRWWHAKS